jgi:F-type H+-transporting ATPase subunit epsilon
MKLTVTTPLEIVLDADGVAHVRAEDASGAFGILPGHADFLTVLAVSVLTWRDVKGADHHIAVRGGMLQVLGGQAITVDTREAVANHDLHHLRTEVLAVFRREAEEDREARVSAERLYLNAIQRIAGLARPVNRPPSDGGPG